MSDLIISGILVRIDGDGRYCLNDLHKAAGGESKHQPAKWLITQQAIDLIELLKSEKRDTGILVSEQNQPLKVYKGRHHPAFSRIMMRKGAFRRRNMRTVKLWPARLHKYMPV